MKKTTKKIRPSKKKIQQMIESLVSHASNATGVADDESGVGFVSTIDEDFELEYQDDLEELERSIDECEDPLLAAEAEAQIKLDEIQDAQDSMAKGYELIMLLRDLLPERPEDEDY